MKFAHMGDCHLGGWKQPVLRELNFQSFQKALNTCISEKVDFILISGDLFDAAYPSIETLKQTFQEFKNLHDAKIPVFLIAGSHDYSISGKTFLDVLERAGFCKNVAQFEEKNERIFLLPTVYKNIAIYGYPGKKGGLEVEEIERISLHDSPGLFRILLLHTAIRDAVGMLPIKAVNQEALPRVDYLALSHLHINYQKNNRVYSGPIFPNNLLELEELKGGSFYIFDNGKIRKEEIKIKEVFSFSLEITDPFQAADVIIQSLSNENLTDKIVILKLFGILSKGKTSDLDLSRIEAFFKDKGVYVFLKSTSKLYMPEVDIDLELFDAPNLEEQIIKKYEEKHPNKFNHLLPSLIKALQSEKSEDEKSSVFDERVVSESKRILSI